MGQGAVWRPLAPGPWSAALGAWLACPAVLGACHQAGPSAAHVQTGLQAGWWGSPYWDSKYPLSWALRLGWEPGV